MIKINSKLQNISKNIETLASNIADLGLTINNLGGKKISDFSRASRAKPDAYQKISLSNNQVTSFSNNNAQAYYWDSKTSTIKSINRISALPLKLLINLSSQKDKLLNNTINFAKGLPANNALLWGARGSGKSALIKSVLIAVSKKSLPIKLALLEVDSADINELDNVINNINRDENVISGKLRVVLFCDDLSFSTYDQSYKTLKNTLFGSLKSNLENIILYATSNKRQLVSQPSTSDLMVSISKKDEIEEATSLADRFGLWLGFHSVSELDYLRIVEVYLQFQFDQTKTFSNSNGLAIVNFAKSDWQSSAKAWARERGSTSGRTAYHFVINFLANNNQKITF